MVDVAQHGARNRRHNADPAREERQRLLVRLVKKAFGGEPRFQLGECLRERPLSLGREAVDIELIDAVAFIDGDAAGRDDRLAIFRTEPQVLRTRTEHDALERRRCIFQREISVSRRINLEIRKLAAHHEASESRFALQQSLDEAVDLADAMNRHHVTPLSLQRFFSKKEAAAPAVHQPRYHAYFFSPFFWPFGTIAPSTPLRNFGDSSAPYFFASSMASSMATPASTAVSAYCIS